jgi:hypothetical protein
MCWYFDWLLREQVKYFCYQHVSEAEPLTFGSNNHSWALPLEFLYCASSRQQKTDE